jgi:hypothetical protein
MGMNFSGLLQGHHTHFGRQSQYLVASRAAYPAFFVFAAYQKNSATVHGDYHNFRDNIRDNGITPFRNTLTIDLYKTYAQIWDYWGIWGMAGIECPENY